MRSLDFVGIILNFTLKLKGCYDNIRRTVTLEYLESTVR